LASTVDLGDTLVGAPETQLITVTNQGSVPLLVSSITVPVGFSVINDSVTNQLIPQGSAASFTLQLNASGIGPFSGVVTINDNISNANLFEFNVTGSVTAPVIAVQHGSTTLANGTNTQVDAADTFNVGTTTVGTSITQLITVTNQGNAPLIVQPATFPAGFSVLNNFSVNQVISVGSSASFTLELNATSPGDITGAVTILSNDTTASLFTFNVTGIVTPVGSTAVPVMVVQQASTTLANGSGSVIFNSRPAGSAVMQVISVSNFGNTPRPKPDHDQQ
jgi:hypothetical protein